MVQSTYNQNFSSKVNFSEFENNMEKMYVIKRNGRREAVMFDKITSRIRKLCYRLNDKYIDPASITYKVIGGLYSGVTTVELDNLAAEIAATMTTRHSDYAILYV